MLGAQPTARVAFWPCRWSIKNRVGEGGKTESVRMCERGRETEPETDRQTLWEKKRTR